MTYIINYHITISYMFSEATTTALESFTNSTGKHLCWSLFLKKLQVCRLGTHLYMSLFLSVCPSVRPSIRPSVCHTSYLKNRMSTNHNF